MDPMMLMQLLGQLPGYGQSQGQMGQPQGQLPSMMPQGQMPMGQPQPEMPQMGQPMPQGDQGGSSHHNGLSPWMMLSPMGGLFASHPKAALSMMSPAFGIANLLGAFK